MKRLITAFFIMAFVSVKGQDRTLVKEEFTIDTVNKKEFENLQKYLFFVDDKIKLRKLLIIKLNYQEQINRIKADASILSEDKRKVITRLIDEKNFHISKVLSNKEMFLFLQGEPRLAPAGNMDLKKVN